MTPVAFKILLGLVSLAISAVSGLAETSFLSLSRLQLARLEKARPGRLSFWAEDPDRTLAVILLINNLVNVGIGFLAAALALGGSPWATVVFPVVAAVVVIIFGEIVPKVIARLAPEKIALFLAPALQVAVRLLGPVVGGFVNGTSALLERISDRVKAEGSWDPHVMRGLLETTPLSRAARTVVTGLLDFGRRPVEEVMVPAEEIFAVGAFLPRSEIMRLVAASGYSRVPVHAGSLDKIQGVLYAKDLLAASRESDLIVLQDLIRPVARVPAATPMADILRLFREGHLHMALVTDRGGRVRGLVTLQDLLEAIVGPVAEEPAAPGAAA